MNSKINEELKAVYNRYAGKRDADQRPEWKKMEREYALKAFRGSNCATMLEIGPGTGQDSLIFKENGLQVYAIDLSDEHVRCCCEKGIPAAAMDICNMTLDHESFDCIYSINCFLHIPKSDLNRALQETRKVMKPGGLFYLGVYGGKDFEGSIKWKDYYDAERYFAFYMFDDYLNILKSLFSIMDAREVRLSDDLMFHAFLLRKKRCQPVEM